MLTFFAIFLTLQPPTWLSPKKLSFAPGQIRTKEGHK